MRYWADVLGTKIYNLACKHTYVERVKNPCVVFGVVVLSKYLSHKNVFVVVVFARQASRELKATTLPTYLTGSINNLQQNSIIPHEPLCGMKGSDVCGQAFAQVTDKPTASPTGLCLPWFVFPAKRFSEENDTYFT